ncbi:MAG: MotA/TolQ/ExbB proton channel family protein [Methylococcaceae bacterium]
MRLLITFLVSMSFYSIAKAEHLDLDQLLREVKKSQGIEGKINRKREARFLAEKNRQQQLLLQAKKELAAQTQRSETLKAQLAKNDQALTALENELKERSGETGELFGVAKQAAGDLKVELTHSFISAQFPRRGQALDKMSKQKELPTIADLETLWLTLQQEMTEAGKVVKYPAEIMSSSGETEQAAVVRIGNFNVLAGKDYLRYLPESEKLVRLVRQPDSEFTSIAEDFATSAKSGKMTELALDPTRGSILNMLVQVPNRLERVKQGGFIGYIIIALGIVGLILIAERFIDLSRTGKKMRSQMNNLGKIVSDNPLGRVLAVSDNNKVLKDTETLELMLDEAVTRELPALEKRLSTIKLLAAVAPLLGLLGTVTGMIATFQAISLFGTGDPKLMASGISEALVTTMLGLSVAIPLLFLHNYVSARSKALIQILDEQVLGLVARRVEGQ